MPIPDNGDLKYRPHQPGGQRPFQAAEAKTRLYDLLTHFRKSANRADNEQEETLFNFAAEVTAGLARAFRQYEESAALRRQQQGGGGTEVDNNIDTETDTTL